MTDELNIEVEWQPLLTHEDTRGSPVTSYHLRWDKRTYGLVYYDLIGLDSDFVLNEFI
jgi:hypothetical protein